MLSLKQANDRQCSLRINDRVSPQDNPRAVAIAGRKFVTTPVFEAYWRFAAERQRIFFDRATGATEPPLTKDPILAQYKFTNTYRASDRVSQYLIRNVIYRDDLPNSPDEIFFRILLFKVFNKIETWELLERTLGPITLSEYAFSAYDRVLSQRMVLGDTIYSAAYIMPSCGSVFGYAYKHQNHLKLIEWMLQQDFPRKLQDARSMQDAFELMLSAPSIGPFLAYQYVTDLNYSELTNFAENTFVVAGPGALDGIEKCFAEAREASASDVIRFMYERQDEYFSRYSLKFQTLWGRPLQLIDCQNIFCEISKYARVAFPAVEGRTARKRIKQKFKSHGGLPAPWYPPKWKLNGRIETYLRESPGSEIAKAVQLTMF